MHARELRQRTGFRVLGLDDGPFTRTGSPDVLVVGPVLRGSGQLDGLLSTTITRDGFDATERLAEMIVASKFLPQLHYILLGGVTVGGFNVVDLPALAAATGRGVLAVTRRPPDLVRMHAATEALPDPPRRRALLQRAGPVLRLAGLCCQLHGLEPDQATAVLEITCQHGRFPEPLRLAHLIAGGLVRGQSTGRA
ncbi:MAG: DUF99 family protein [Myxococcota bacterium]|jgi:endonuclease V-like protein UPF0215 family|nr:DUF99 family protein [Myxococcota bacterium]